MGYLSGRRTSQTSPGKNDNLPLVTATSTVWGSCSIGLLLVLQSRPPQASLICGFCSSAREFALRWTFQPPQSGFLRIPPRDGHPCLWLTVPATESVVDFHHQVIAHAGRTSFMPFMVFLHFFIYKAGGAVLDRSSSGRYVSPVRDRHSVFCRLMISVRIDSTLSAYCVLSSKKTE